MAKSSECGWKWQTSCQLKAVSQRAWASHLASRRLGTAHLPSHAPKDGEKGAHLSKLLAQLVLGLQRCSSRRILFVGPVSNWCPVTRKCASSLSHGTSHSLSQVAKVQHLSMLFLWHSTQELPIDGVLATEIDKAALRPDALAGAPCAGTLHCCCGHCWRCCLRPPVRNNCVRHASSGFSVVHSLKFWGIPRHPRIKYHRL